MEGGSQLSNPKKNPALLYLGRFQCDYLSEGGMQSFRFPFTPEVIRDLEVFNVSLLFVQIKAFVAYFKIQPSELTILLADDILFSKTFTLPDPKSREDAIQVFIESVPFEETGVVQVPLQNSVTVSVANKLYYDAFKTGFEALGFTVTLALPAFLLNKEVNLAKSADVASLSLALKHTSTHRQYSLLAQHSAGQAASVVEGKGDKLKSNKRTLLLVGLFVILIGVLVIVYMLSYSQPLTSPANNQVTPAIQSSTVQPQSKKVSVGSMQVIYQLSSQERVNQITSLMKEVGITSVSSASVTVVATTSGSTLLFSPNVTEDDRGVILAELQKIVPTISIIEGNIASIDAILNLNE